MAFVDPTRVAAWKKRLGPFSPSLNEIKVRASGWDLRQESYVHDYESSSRKLVTSLPKIRAASRLFKDPLSRKTYLDLMKYRSARILDLIAPELVSCLLPEPVADIYFPRELVDEPLFRHFIDCGAFDGDTLASILLMSPSPRMERYSAFEPDPVVFATLKKKIGKWKSQIGPTKVDAVPMALSDRGGKIGFIQTHGGGASRPARGSRSKVAAIRLDDFMAGHPATFIKVEAEGGEVAVLNGAAETIRKWRPFLAVTVYHEAQDLWEIPLALKKIAPDYRLVLRHHGPFCCRTVCYGIPRRHRSKR